MNNGLLENIKEIVLPETALNKAILKKNSFNGPTKKTKPYLEEAMEDKFTL